VTLQRSDRRESEMKRFRWFGLALPLAAIVGVLVVALPSSAAGGARHVRWDIISLAFTTPMTVNPGGFADATAPDGTTIRLTGSGTFVAPSGQGKGSNGASGGGTWQILPSGPSGTYEVKGLADFEFANFQSPGLNDNIGDTNERANGNAVLTIRYSDGGSGTLVIGCHGPGAPAGIFEGVTATKGFKTYDEPQEPAPGVDANRTIFHVHVR
jgi:hypothetical protein